MKHIMNLAFALGLTFSLSAKTNYIADYTYTIHIGAFIKAQFSDFDNIRTFGYLYSEKLNNLQQIYMGDYPSEGEANEVLSKVKSNGYPDAFVTRRSLGIGKTVSVIQLGTTPLDDAIDWNRFTKAGPLQVLLAGNNIRVVTGPFDSFDLAKQRLGILRKMGFKDAFLKNINDVLLHKVTEFEVAGQAELRADIDLSSLPPEPIAVEEEAPKAIVETITPKAPKESPKPDVTPPPVQEIPKEFDKVVFTPKAIKMTKTSIAAPRIRTKVKRTSVLELQKILKAEGTYQSSLDGFYGRGTSNGYKKWMNNSKAIKRYQLLIKNDLIQQPQLATNTLQQAINDLNRDPSAAMKALEGSKEPTAKAYLAYVKFATRGTHAEVNTLMNQAVKAAFTGQKLKNQPPFNYTADYDYKDMGQLLLHLRYIQEVSTTEVATPFWLFQRHPIEAKQAFKSYNGMEAVNYKVEDCLQFMNWESLKLLNAIVMDMNPDVAKTSLASYTTQGSLRSRILMASQPLSKEDYTAVDKWNTALWQKLAAKEKEDPLYTRMFTPMRVSYFQSWALLEDYFMDKGFTAKDARGLSLAVLRTIVKPQVKRLVEE